MYFPAWLLVLSTLYPLHRAWRASRGSTLRHTLAWATLAWLPWWYLAFGTAVFDGRGAMPEAVTYVPVCLTACAGVAVLGARRPGVGAWNFVVLGLLVILLLPFAEGLGRLELSWPRLLFLGAVVAVGFLNYLPTRLGLPAALIAGVCGASLWSIARGLETRHWEEWEITALWAAPWAAFVLLKWWRPASEFDRTWQAFRDSFGALWAERTRQQFNRAAANAGLAGRLGWCGLRAAPAAEQEQLLTILQALLKRFGPAE
jgi:hypothetical protein